MTIIEQLARELNRPAEHIENVVRLLDEGNTIPFIARYRKEMTGSLDDQLLRQLADRLAYLRGLDEQREKIRAVIEDQGKLSGSWPPHWTPRPRFLSWRICTGPTVPGGAPGPPMAREKGLEPLADALYAQPTDGRTVASGAGLYRRGRPNARGCARRSQRYPGRTDFG